MKYVVLDFETCSSCDLLKSGAWKYAEDFSSAITHIGFKVVVDNIPRPSRIIWGRGLNKVDPELYELVCDPKIMFLAHNCSFELGIWKHLMVPLGYQEIPLERWHDTMCAAAMRSLPLGLDPLTKALELPVQKDMEGHRLMLKMCKPDKDGGWSHHTQENLQREAEYCVGDVDSQYAVHTALGGLGDERRVWLTDQRINQRGILIDVPFVRACMDVLDQVRVPMTAEFKELTGGIAPTQREKILVWVNEQGVNMTDMRKETLDAMLDPDDELGFEQMDQFGIEPLPYHVHRALTLRRSLASSSVAKLERMLQCACLDGRVRYTMQYHGAGTGRWAGRLIQIQNYPRGEIQERQGLTPEILADAIMSRDLNRITELWGPDIFSAVISSLRSCIIPDVKKGRILTVGDFAQVEARNVLSFAGHHDRAMEMDTTDAYAELGSMIFKMPVNKKDNPRERQIGKNGLLGCLSATSMVLTDAGWKAIVEVSTKDKLWDGKDWVTHEGLAFKGSKETLTLSGLRLTPEHPVFDGERWFRADEVTKPILSQALAFAMSHGPSGAMPTPKAATLRGTFVTVIAEAVRFLWSPTISTTGNLHGAILAQKRKLLKLFRSFFGVTPTFVRIRNTAQDFSIVSAPSKAGALFRHLRGMLNITLGGEFPFSLIGLQLALAGRKVVSNRNESFWPIFSRLKAGTTRIWKLTELTITETTNPGISGLSQEPKICKTAAQYSNSKPKLNVSEPVYDLVNAGPRNRFCVMTSDGPLIVHNSGFGLGYNGFQAKFAPKEPFDLAVRAIDTYRKDYAPLVPKFWYGLYQASVDAVWCQFARTYVWEGIEFRKEGDFLTMRLPSGRKIYYHKPMREVSYNPKTGNEYPAWSFLSYQGKKNRRLPMWYGQLMNNLVQGSARDLMVNAILICEHQGLPVVFTAHDEVVLETLDRPGLAEMLRDIMQDIPQWARERRFNVKAECDTMYRYRK